MNRTFFLAILIALSAFGLTACGGKSDEEVAVIAKTAKDAGYQSGVDMADSMLSDAKTYIKRIAPNIARQGAFSSEANCNVLPQGLMSSPFVKNFPVNGPSEYRAACAREVAVMNAEIATVKANAVADDKRAEQKKLAAKKAAEQKMAAAKASKTGKKPGPAHKGQG